MKPRLCTRCGKAKPPSAFYKNAGNKRDGLGSRCKPCVDEVKKEWIAAHPERVSEHNRRRRSYKRKWENAFNHRPEGRAECVSCGQLRGFGTRWDNGGVCRYCVGAEVDFIGTQLEQLWAKGKSGKEIQAAMDWSRGMFAKSMHEYRQRGYALPYRYAMHDGQRIPAGTR